MDSNSKKSVILNGAIKIFAERGYKNTSVKLLCDSLKINKPTLYYYFDSKESLLREAIEEVLHNMAGYVKEAVEDKEDMETALKAILDSHLKFVRENPHKLKFIYTIAFSPEKEIPFYDVFQLHRQTIKGFLREIIERAATEGRIRDNLGTQEILLAFAGLLHMFMMVATRIFSGARGSEFNYDPDSLSALGNRMLDVFLRGVLK